MKIEDKMLKQAFFEKILMQRLRLEQSSCLVSGT